MIYLIMLKYNLRINYILIKDKKKSILEINYVKRGID